MKKPLISALLLSSALLFSSCGAAEELLNTNTPDSSQVTMKKRVGGITKNGLTLTVPQDWKRNSGDGVGDELVSYRSEKEKSNFKVIKKEAEKIRTPQELKPDGFDFLDDTTTVAGRPAIVFKSAEDKGFRVFVQVQDRDSSTDYYSYEFRYLAKKPSTSMGSNLEEILGSVHWVTDTEFSSQYLRPEPTASPRP